MSGTKNLKNNSMKTTMISVDMDMLMDEYNLG